MSEQNLKNIMALDLGYSSDKASYLSLEVGERPSDALARIKVDHCPGGVQDFGTTDQAVASNSMSEKVSVEGRSYVAGVNHKTVGHDRQRSDHFIYEPEWKARFYAALKRSGFESRVIDVLVLGLPCEQFYNHIDPQQKSDHVIHIEQTCQGLINTGDDLPYEVKKVVVMAQPHGTYWGFFGKTGDSRLQNLARRGSILVMDIGYYTFDWINLDKLSVVLKNSNSRSNAYHQVLSSAAGTITSELRESGLIKAAVSPDDIEDALFNGEKTVFVGAKEIKIDDYLLSAAEDVSQQVLKAVEGDVGKTPPNMIIVSGGGAKHFSPHIVKWAENIGAEVVTPNEPERLNAYGYMTNAIVNHI